MEPTRAFREKRVNIQKTCALSIGIPNQDVQENTEPAECSRDLIRSYMFKLLFPELEIKQDKDTKLNFRVQKRALHENGMTCPRL